MIEWRIGPTVASRVLTGTLPTSFANVTAIDTVSTIQVPFGNARQVRNLLVSAGDNITITDRADGVGIISSTDTGTEVEANPTGTDGDDLARIRIDGTNFNIPGSDDTRILDHDLTTDYVTNDVVTDPTSNEIYRALQNNNNTALTDQDNWERIGGTNTTPAPGQMGITRIQDADDLRGQGLGTGQILTTRTVNGETVFIVDDFTVPTHIALKEYHTGDIVKIANEDRNFDLYKALDNTIQTPASDSTEWQRIDFDPELVDQEILAYNRRRNIPRIVHTHSTDYTDLFTASNRMNNVGAFGPDVADDDKDFAAVSSLAGTFVTIDGGANNANAGAINTALGVNVSGDNFTNTAVNPPVTLALDVPSQPETPIVIDVNHISREQNVVPGDVVANSFRAARVGGFSFDNWSALARVGATNRKMLYAQKEDASLTSFPTNERFRHSVWRNTAGPVVSSRDSLPTPNQTFNTPHNNVVSFNSVHLILNNAPEGDLTNRPLGGEIVQPNPGDTPVFNNPTGVVKVWPINVTGNEAISARGSVRRLGITYRNPTGSSVSNRIQGYEFTLPPEIIGNLGVPSQAHTTATESDINAMQNDLANALERHGDNVKAIVFQQTPVDINHGIHYPSMQRVTIGLDAADASSTRTYAAANPVEGYQSRPDGGPANLDSSSAVGDNSINTLWFNEVWEHPAGGGAAVKVYPQGQSSTTQLPDDTFRHRLALRLTERNTRHTEPNGLVHTNANTYRVEPIGWDNLSSQEQTTQLNNAVISIRDAAASSRYEFRLTEARWTGGNFAADNGRSAYIGSGDNPLTTFEAREAPTRVPGDIFYRLDGSFNQATRNYFTDTANGASRSTGDDTDHYGFTNLQVTALANTTSISSNILEAPDGTTFTLSTDDPLTTLPTGVVTGASVDTDGDLVLTREGQTDLTFAGGTGPGIADNNVTNATLSNSDNTLTLNRHNATDVVFNNTTVIPTNNVTDATTSNSGNTLTLVREGADDVVFTPADTGSDVHFGTGTSAGDLITSVENNDNVSFRNGVLQVDNQVLFNNDINMPVRGVNTNDNVSLGANGQLNVLDQVTFGTDGVSVRNVADTASTTFDPATGSLTIANDTVIPQNNVTNADVNLVNNTLTLNRQGADDVTFTPLSDSNIVEAATSNNGNTLTLSQNSGPDVVFTPTTSAALPTNTVTNAAVNDGEVTLNRQGASDVTFESLQDNNVTDASINGNTLSLIRQGVDTITYTPTFEVPTNNVTNASVNTDGNTLTLNRQGADDVTFNNNPPITFGTTNNLVNNIVDNSNTRLSADGSLTIVGTGGGDGIEWSSSDSYVADDLVYDRTDNDSLWVANTAVPSGTTSPSTNPIVAGTGLAEVQTIGFTGTRTNVVTIGGNEQLTLTLGPSTASPPNRAVLNTSGTITTPNSSAGFLGTGRLRIETTRTAGLLRSEVGEGNEIRFVSGSNPPFRAMVTAFTPVTTRADGTIASADITVTGDNLNAGSWVANSFVYFFIDDLTRSTFTYNPGSETLFGAGAITRTIPYGLDQLGILNFISDEITDAYNIITETSISAPDASGFRSLTLDIGTTNNVIQDLVFTANDGIIDRPTITFTDGSNTPAGEQSIITITSPDGNVIENFNSGTSSESNNNISDVTGEIISLINANTDFTATVSGSQIVITANSPGEVTGRFSITVNNGSQVAPRAGTLIFGSADKRTSGNDPMFYWDRRNINPEPARPIHFGDQDVTANEIVRVENNDNVSFSEGVLSVNTGIGNIHASTGLAPSGSTTIDFPGDFARSSTRLPNNGYWIKTGITNSLQWLVSGSTTPTFDTNQWVDVEFGGAGVSLELARPGTNGGLLFNQVPGNANAAFEDNSRLNQTDLTTGANAALTGTQSTNRWSVGLPIRLVSADGDVVLGGDDGFTIAQLVTTGGANWTRLNDATGAFIGYQTNTIQPNRAVGSDDRTPVGETYRLQVRSFDVGDAIPGQATTATMFTFGNAPGTYRYIASETDNGTWIQEHLPVVAAPTPPPPGVLRVSNSVNIDTGTGPNEVIYGNQAGERFRVLNGINSGGLFDVENTADGTGRILLAPGFYRVNALVNTQNPESVNVRSYPRVNVTLGTGNDIVIQGGFGYIRDNSQNERTGISAAGIINVTGTDPQNLGIQIDYTQTDVPAGTSHADIPFGNLFVDVERIS